MRVLMVPHLDQLKNRTSGIDQVIAAYFRHLPDFDIELAGMNDHYFDLVAGHVGSGLVTDIPYVAHTHGLYWSGDFHCDQWQMKANAQIVNAIRNASQVTVPSAWVAESFQRDMRFTPHVIEHGIDWQDWQHDEPIGGYVLWNKNRALDVCDPTPLVELAKRFEKGHFVTTFLPPRVPKPNNTNVIGLVVHDQMKKLVQSSLVYLSTTKETFGIGVLEAMASGVPVLGFAHGGNLETVKHGVNGYLARPGDFDDLEYGLSYCIAYRKTLGANGRELAKQWTWQTVCEKVANVYRLAVESQSPTVAVIIPVYNKTEQQVSRALQSVLEQTYDQITAIIIVDDGSEDQAIVKKVITQTKHSDGRIRLLRQNNSGVAVARNAGIGLAGRTKYACCLDSDDAIEPEFIARCVKALEADRSLGIAYTGLQWIKPDGSTGVSQWPGEFDYDKQLYRRNQIPTCCVFKREMWERLGGYRQRYAPDGCGAEDAEFWLRAGAYGYGAKKVTQEPLFVYSWMSGQVSGNPNYREMDWTSMHPWAGDTNDGKHPFASLAKPKNFSHPVRQYDEPLVSVIIPVGPGHEEKVIDALDSLESQTFRNWEVVIVDDTGTDATYYLHKSYPYARIILTGDNEGSGFARNEGARFARGSFLVFLDADDRLYPEFLSECLDAWNETESIIYTDYVGKAVISPEHATKMQKVGKLLNYDETTGHAIIAHKSDRFDCERAQRQPEQIDDNKPWYHWCLVTALIPKIWHDAVGGFDESMESWEDVDYHWRLAKAGYCYHHLKQQLIVYQFHTGNRRETGRQIHQKLLQYLIDKYKGIENMPCPGGCGGRRAKRKTVQANPAQVIQSAQISDEDFIWCLYINRNKGKHPVWGAHRFAEKPVGIPSVRTGNGYLISYGARNGGGKERFLVHRKDIELRPSDFLPIDDGPKAPVPERVPLDAPKIIADSNNGAASVIVTEHPSGIDWMTDDAPEIEAPKPLEQILLENAREILDPKWDKPVKLDLQTIPGIGPALVKQLTADGIDTVEKIVALGIDGLAAYRGVGQHKARVILGAVESKQ